MSETDIKLLEAFIQSRGDAASRILEGIPDAEISVMLKELNPATASTLLNHISRYKASKCLSLLDPDHAAELLEKMNPTSSELLLRQVDTPLAEIWMEHISPQIASRLKQKLSFKSNSVGAMMKSKTLILKEDFKIGQALTSAREFADLTTPYGYIVRNDHTISGIVELHDLIRAEVDQEVASIMKTNIPKLLSELPLEAVLHHPGWQDFYELPVIDSSDVFLGALNVEVVFKWGSDTGREMSKQMIKTGMALGELYRVGFTGLLRSAGE